MKHVGKMTLAVAAALSVVAGSAQAQRAPDAEARKAEERTAIARYDAMNGVWRGRATYQTAQGPQEFIQTERVGPMLGGTIRVVEGRGYDLSGKVVFNAFAVMSFDPDKDAYFLRSYSEGREGNFGLSITDEGYVWEVPAGPGATIRYVAVIGDGTWRETGHRIVAGQEPQKFFEMELTRIGDSDWPASGAVPHQ